MGRANKWADKWAKDGTNVWHEKWGEEYDGEGGCVKFTDKVLLVYAQTFDVKHSVEYFDSGKFQVACALCERGWHSCEKVRHQALLQTHDQLLTSTQQQQLSWVL